MRPILLVEDEAICRLPMQRLLELSGFTASAAADGREALLMLSKQTFGLVMLDLNLPFVDGMGVLKAIRKDERNKNTPVIILSSQVDRATVLEASRLGVKSYLLKAHFSLDQLLELVNKHLSQPPAGEANSSSKPEAAGIPATPSSGTITDSKSIPPKPLTRDETIGRVKEFTQSKTLAGVAAEIIAMASAPRAGIAELLPVLKRDAALSTRTLEIANGALLASHKPRITTLEEAVRDLGLNKVRNIATSAGIFDLFPAEGAGGSNAMRCWQHCFAVAAVMDRIVPAEGLQDKVVIPPGVAHMIGLCHDLGEIVLQQGLAAEYAEVAKIATETGRPHHEVEATLFGLTHRELTAIVLEKLGLPKAVIDPIREYLSAIQSGKPKGLSKIASVLRLADYYAHALQLASFPNALVSPVSIVECKAILGKQAFETFDGMGLRGEVISQTNLLARLSRAEEMAMARPFFSQANTGIWYARHATLMESGPESMALGLICKPQSRDRLPAKPDEFKGCKAVVIAAPQPFLAPFTADAIRQMLKSSGTSVPVRFLYEEELKSPQMVPGVELLKYPCPLSSIADFVTRAEKKELASSTEAKRAVA